MQLIRILGAFSVLLALEIMLGSACGEPPRPNADGCIANVPALHLKCYNIHDDYDDNGQLKPDVKPHFVEFKSRDEMLDFLNKSTVFQPDAWALVKAWIRKLRGAP